MRMINGFRASAALGGIFLGAMLIGSTPASARYGFCLAQIPGKTTPIPNQYNTSYPSYLSDILDFGVGEEHSRVAGRQFAASVGQPQGATCYSHFEDVGAAIYYKAELQKKQAGYHIESGWNGGYAAAAPVKRASDRTLPAVARQTAPDRPKPAPAAPKYVEVAGPNGIQRLSPEVAARNQAAADEYRRKMEEHAAAKAEHDRKLALHQQSQSNAALAKAEHDREVAAAAERVAAHRVALAEHARKLAGASTDDDPNRCITSPAIKPGLRGNTEARVTNGCDQKVDIVICLKRSTGDWLCGAQFGILSQRTMTFMSTNATGEIYVDAVTFGSGNKLGRPAGIIK